MIKKYEWRVLGDDGLLTKPKALGPYYDKVCFNKEGVGHDSEDEAIKNAKEIREKYPFCDAALVLVTVHYFNN